MQVHSSTANRLRETNVFSWRNSTVSPPSLCPATSSAFMGGAVASLRSAMASSDIYGHLVMGSAPCATFIQNAMQVGLPHSLQFFLGESLKMSRPLTAIIRFLLLHHISAAIILAMVAIADG